MIGYAYSYSERQLRIYNFVKRVGPSPEPALEVLFGLRTVKALTRLQQAGYLSRCKLHGVNFWLHTDAGYFDFPKQETIAWFAARLEEVGGKYEGEFGTSPNGTRFRISYSPGCVHIADEENHKFVALLEDLKRFQLTECLKWEKKLKPS